MPDPEDTPADAPNEGGEKKAAKKKSKPKKKKAETKGEAKTAENEEERKKRQEIEAAEQAVQDDLKAQEQRAQEVEENKKKVARKDYEDHLESVNELKEMTDTKAWQKFYANLQRAIAKAGRSVLDAEKTRDIIKFQESVKIIRQIIAKVKEPVNEMNTFCTAAPLFVQQFPVRAGFNDATGKVELSGIKG